jgi:hypothetical protein
MKFNAFLLKYDLWMLTLLTLICTTLLLPLSFTFQSRLLTTWTYVNIIQSFLRWLFTSIKNLKLLLVHYVGLHICCNHDLHVIYIDQTCYVWHVFHKFGYDGSKPVNSTLELNKTSNFTIKLFMNLLIFIHKFPHKQIISNIMYVTLGTCLSLLHLICNLT